MLITERLKARAASLISFCQGGEGIIIVDAGGGTVDLSAYCRTTSPNSFEEIAPSECMFLSHHQLKST